MRLSSILCTTLLAGTAFGQCFSVTTTTAAGNGQNGTMFDVVNISAGAINIGSFDQCFFSGTSDTVEIYTKMGTWNGFEATAGAWTLVGSATVPHGVAPILDPVAITVNVNIGAGATQGFYITTTAGTVAYTTGVAQLGTVIGTDGVLNVTAGPGKVYPFGGSFGLPTDGRLWNGRVNYCPVGAGTVATNMVLGTGCGASPNFDSFYQTFADAALASTALTGNALILTPSGTGYQGAWVPGGGALYVTPTGGATTLLTGDDGVVAYTIPSGSLTTPYGSKAVLQVSGNAIIGFGTGTLTYPGTNSFTPTPAGFLDGAPEGGVYAWHDYNAAEVGSGAIVAEQVGGVVYVTFNGVESYSTPVALNPSTLQFQLTLATGQITIVFQSIDNNITSTFGSSHLVGVSGPGVSADPGAIVLATATPAQLLTVAPVLALGLSAVTRPLLGTNWNLSVNNIPASTVFGVTLFGTSDPAILDLAFLGMPGCQLRSSLGVIDGPWFPGGSTFAYSFAVPAGPLSLLGFNLFTQAATFGVPPVNSFGAITSNGIKGTLGNL